MKVDNAKLVKHIQDKMYAEMADKRETFGLRYFGKQIGISAPTLSRVLSNGDSKIELTTFVSLVNWLGQKSDDYLIMEHQNKTK